MSKKRRSSHLAQHKKRAIIEYLLEHYGNECCYCKQPMIIGEAFKEIAAQRDNQHSHIRTIEHLDSNFKNNAQANLRLAHFVCNNAVQNIDKNAKLFYIRNTALFLRKFFPE